MSSPVIDKAEQHKDHSSLEESTSGSRGRSCSEKRESSSKEHGPLSRYILDELWDQNGELLTKDATLFLDAAESQEEVLISNRPHFPPRALRKLRSLSSCEGGLELEPVASIAQEPADIIPKKGSVAQEEILNEVVLPEIESVNIPVEEEILPVEEKEASANEELLTQESLLIHEERRESEKESENQPATIARKIVESEPDRDVASRPVTLISRRNVSSFLTPMEKPGIFAHFITLVEKHQRESVPERTESDVKESKESIGSVLPTSRGTESESADPVELQALWTQLTPRQRHSLKDFLITLYDNRSVSSHSEP